VVRVDDVGLTFVPEVGGEEDMLMSEEEEEAATRWEGVMPALSCSEDEGLVFNLGDEPFKHVPQGCVARGCGDCLSGWLLAYTSTRCLSLPSEHWGAP
jgi:hypothetical protein